MSRLLAALCVLLPAAAATTGTAAAQDRPAALPTRDVDVTYRSEQAGQVLEQRSRFAAGPQLMRLDTPTPGLWVLVDYRAHRMSMVSDPDRGALDMATPPGGPPGAPPGATGGAYVRRGQDRVAGLPCTEWEVRDNQGQAALTCFTEDGVMLRARRGAQVLAVATRVAFGPMDPALFAIPANYGHATRR